MKAIAQAAQSILLGDADIVVAAVWRRRAMYLHADAMRWGMAW